tara:strand:- start:593 stop:928 length:336 start_codon:yes stop_codon:yes gene_type:complete
MTNKKRILSVAGSCLLVLALLLAIKPIRPCRHCGLPIEMQDIETEEIKIFRESLIAIMFSPNASFLHWLCVEGYLRDNPIERDEKGAIIQKIGYAQEPSIHLPLVLPPQEE